MKVKNVLVLPGSNWQVQLVEKIKEMGHKVFVVNPFDASPCFSYADDFLKSDIFDIQKVKGYIAKNNIDAVISDECDIAMPLVAMLADEFGFSALSKEDAHLYTDKFAMREFCKANGINYPQYKLCKTAEDAFALLDEIKRPLIIKPLDCNASKGVFKVETKEDILRHFDESMKFSRIEKSVLAERYINGTEFTIDGIKTPNGHYTLAISEKKHFKHNVNIASDLLFTHKHKDFDYEKLKKQNDSFVLASDLKFGFTHAEYKYEDGEFYLIEIAARGGGNMISSLITQYMSGYDTYKYLINCYLGNITEETFEIKDEFLNRASILKFFKTPNGGGKVADIKGLEILENEPDVVKYMLNFAVGDVIEDAVSDSARIGFCIICSDNLDKLNSVVEKIDENFNIVLES